MASLDQHRELILLVDHEPSRLHHQGKDQKNSQKSGEQVNANPCLIVEKSFFFEEEKTENQKRCLNK
jgi:hypothetical protein